MKCILTKWKDKIGLFGLEENRLVKAALCDIEQKVCVGDVYVGRVGKILPSIQTYFVQIGQDEVFLPFTETKRNYKSGEHILLQIKKEAAKGKQPLGTDRLSISGLYCVVSWESHSIQASSKLKKEEKIIWIQKLSDALKSSYFQEEEKELLLKYHVIVRTNVVNASSEEEVWKEWLLLAQKMDDLIKKSVFLKPFTKLYQEEIPYLSKLKNDSLSTIDEIITDEKVFYDELIDFFRNVPAFRDKIRFYQDDFSLHKLYGLENKLEEALSRKVWLKNGGFLIIEPTEALTVIDVNSGKYDKNSSSEDYYRQVNDDAAVEIARQITLRNISGIIIIDFINMQRKENQEYLLERLKMLVSKDTIKTSVIGMTHLGLVEMTREKKEKPLWEQLM